MIDYLVWLLLYNSYVVLFTICSALVDGYVSVLSVSGAFLCPHLCGV